MSTQAQNDLQKVILELLRQYANDMRYPPNESSRARRVTWIEQTITALEAEEVAS